MEKKLFFISLLFICFSNSKSQDTLAIFSKNGLDRGVHILKTRGSEFIATGITTDGVLGAEGLVLKYSSHMQLKWSKSYGGKNYDFIWGIAETKDGGSMVTGFTNSFGKGAFDCWILRLNKDGDTLWTRTFGDKGDDRAISVVGVSDGNFVVVGQTSSWGKGDNDVLLFKISASGEILWYKTLGETKSDRGFYVVEADNKDLIISGITENNSNKDVDALVVRTNKNGETIWTKSFGGKGSDVAHSLMLNGKQIVIGGYKEYKPGNHQPWVFKLDAEGNVTGEQMFEMAGDARIIGGYLNAENEFIGAGYTRQTENSDWNMFFIKHGKDGRYTSRTYSMPQEDQAYGICEYKKGSSVAVGHSLSIRNKDGDLLLWYWNHD